MSTTEQLGVLLHNYTLKQESAFVDLREFCDYLRKYAARYLEEQPDLLPFVEITEASLLEELKDLAARREVYIQGTVAGKTSFIGISYYSTYFAKRYKDILLNPAIPFPVLGDLPKQLPPDVLEKQNASAVIPLFNRNQDTESQQLYILKLPRDVPAVLFPACVPVEFLVRAAMIKIRRMLKKDEFHDYFQKKLRVANPRKEMMSQNFFSKFVQFPDSEDFQCSLEGDSLYFWTQLCYFIRQDFEKVKDRVSEDTNILQAVSISEIWMASIKESALKAQAKAKALAELEAALARPPYFFSMDGILKFTDSKGALLYGQFSEEDLKA
ncbi:MAG: hypothetical protein K2H09_05045, partial [Treponemataceae bacterium]|nr:hypothetical protein [Treponemataceae bacterium]